MAITEIIVEMRADDWGKARINAECSRKPDGCWGKVELECRFDNTPRATSIKWPQGEFGSCSECGAAFRLTDTMRIKLIHTVEEEARKVAK
jgi:hypothetical protein